MALLVLLNNFFHDFSAAGWLFGAVILWSVLRKTGANSTAESATIDVLKTVMCLMRFSVCGIVVFGVVRALAYKEYEWNATAGESQVTLLIIKHIVLAGIFSLGLIQYIMARRLVRDR